MTCVPINIGGWSSVQASPLESERSPPCPRELLHYRAWLPFLTPFLDSFLGGTLADLRSPSLTCDQIGAVLKPPYTSLSRTCGDDLAAKNGDG